MKVNDIIVLENEERFTLLEEIIDNGVKYFLAAGISEEEQIDNKKIVLLRLVEEQDGAYVQVVKDIQLISKLVKKIKETNK